MPHMTPQHVSSAMAQLMPQIIRGVQLDFFLKRRVTQTQLLMLIAIHAYERCIMSMHARSMHVSMPTVSGVVDRLARAGFVRRFPHPRDRRQVLVELTAKGHAFIQDFQGIIRRRWEEVLTTLGPRELDTFYRVVQKLQAALKGQG